MAEALIFRIHDAVATATTAAPTLATDGFELPLQWRDSRLWHLLLQKTSAGGTRTVHLIVHAYMSKLHQFTAASAAAAEPNPIASSDAWHRVFNTGLISEAADFNDGFLLEGLQDYSRLAAEIVANGGTGPNALTVSIGPSSSEIPR